MERVQGGARTGNKEAKLELGALEKIKAVLEQGKWANTVAFEKEEAELVKNFQLLTTKPVIFAVNAAETQMKSLTEEDARKKLLLNPQDHVVIISAKIEEDLQDLSAEEAKTFLSELGVTSSGLDRLIRAAYHVLGYITFFTAGVQEVRAWTVHVGATAPNAAGVIHTDFERGFICAETISYNDFVQAGSEAKAKEAGKMRQEGKTYIVKDGDVFHFRFNV
jgi:GTP-binding protein YchF